MAASLGNIVKMNFFVAELKFVCLIHIAGNGQAIHHMFNNVCILQRAENLLLICNLYPLWRRYQAEVNLFLLRSSGQRDSKQHCDDDTFHNGAN